MDLQNWASENGNSGVGCQSRFRTHSTAQRSVLELGRSQRELVSCSVFRTSRRNVGVSWFPTGYQSVLYVFLATGTHSYHVLLNHANVASVTEGTIWILTSYRCRDEESVCEVAVSLRTSFFLDICDS